MASLTVGLAGITGKFGRLLASALLQNPQISLRGYGRNLAKVPASLSQSTSLTLYQGEAFDETAIQSFVSGCDVVICSYLGGDHLMVDGQKKLIDACEEAGVKRYIASDWALDYTKLQLGELFPEDPMIHMKAYIETKKVVKGVHILIGGFMEPVMSPFFQIWDPQSRSLRYWGEGVEPMEVTSYANAAEFTATVAVDAEAVGIQKYLGERKTIKELAEIFDKVYGFKPKLERLGSLDDLKAKMLDMQATNPIEVSSYMPLFFYYYWVNGQTFVGPDYDDKYSNVKRDTWEDYLRNRTLEQLSTSYFALAN